MCVQGHDPLTFSFLSSFLFFDWVGILWPQLSKVLKLVHWASSVPFPSVPAEAGCLFAVAACVHVFISGESLHCFLAGVNRSYVIATSDLSPSLISLTVSVDVKHHVYLLTSDL